MKAFRGSPPPGLQDASHIEAVVDQGSFFENGRECFGPPDHRWLSPAGRPSPCCCSPAIPFITAAPVTTEACQKGWAVCRSRPNLPSPGGLPMDCPGFMIVSIPKRPQQFAMAVPRHGRRQPDHVPGGTIIVRTSFGSPCPVHPGGPVFHCVGLAVGLLGFAAAEGGIESAYRADIDAADDPKAKLQEIEDRPTSCARVFSLRRAVLGRGNHRSAQDEVAVVANSPACRAPPTPGPATNMTNQA